jgi:hypothetical protein
MRLGWLTADSITKPSRVSSFLGVPDIPISGLKAACGLQEGLQHPSQGRHKVGGFALNAFGRQLFVDENEGAM